MIARRARRDRAWLIGYLVEVARINAILSHAAQERGREDWLRTPPSAVDARLP